MIHQLSAAGQGQAVSCFPAREEEGNLACARKPDLSESIGARFAAGSGSCTPGSLPGQEVTLLGTAKMPGTARRPRAEARHPPSTTAGSGTRAGTGQSPRGEHERHKHGVGEQPSPRARCAGRGRRPRRRCCQGRKQKTLCGSTETRSASVS